MQYNHTARQTKQRRWEQRQYYMHFLINNDDH